jgi:hypothetical protein
MFPCRRRHKEEISRLPDDAKFPKLQLHKPMHPPLPAAATAAQQLPSPPPPPPVLKKSSSPESTKSGARGARERVPRMDRSLSAGEEGKPPQHRSKREGRQKRSKVRQVPGDLGFNAGRLLAEQREHGALTRGADGKVYADIV